jgi:hypothetical protein
VFLLHTSCVLGCTLCVFNEVHLLIYIYIYKRKKNRKKKKNDEPSTNIYLEGFSMKSNPRISSTPRALSCKMTLERLHRLISGFVESSSFSNSLSG